MIVVQKMLARLKKHRRTTRCSAHPEAMCLDRAALVLSKREYTATNALTDDRGFFFRFTTFFQPWTGTETLKENSTIFQALLSFDL